jgi:hypothetical protein
MLLSLILMACATVSSFMRQRHLARLLRFSFSVSA